MEQNQDILSGSELLLLRKKPPVVSWGYTQMIRIFFIYLFFAFALVAVPAAFADELHISNNGEFQAVGKVLSKHALNLMTLSVWGYKFRVFIEPGVRTESSDGQPLKLEEFAEGQTLEVKGKLFPARSEPLDLKLVRNLSVGDKGSSVNPVSESPKVADTKPKDALTQNLYLGMQGKEAAILQEFLQKNGWGIPDDGPVTGYFGSVTQKALMNFQKAKGLEVVGNTGPLTRQLINSLLAK